MTTRKRKRQRIDRALAAAKRPIAITLAPSGRDRTDEIARWLAAFLERHRQTGAESN